MIPAGTLEALLGVLLQEVLAPWGTRDFFSLKPWDFLHLPKVELVSLHLSCHLWVVKGVIPDVDSCRTGVPSMAL